MINTGCDGCFVDQRSINEMLEQTINDATKFANEKKIKVAVFQEGRAFSFQEVTGPLPGGTRCVIDPV